MPIAKPALACLLVLVAGSGCGVTSDDDDPGTISDGKADGLAIPSIGTLSLIKPWTAPVQFVDNQATALRVVFAEFSLSGRATVTFQTARHDDASASTDLDTVLYVYKPDGAYWGHYVAKDDDGGDVQYSSLTTDLDVGSYRLLIRQRGGTGAPVADLHTSCSGDGCVVYPAFRPDAPRIKNVDGGPVLTTPHFTSVTFDGDPHRTDEEAFLASVGPSNYWKATTAEYGIAAATTNAPVHLSHAAPPTLDDAGIKAWIAGQLDGTHPEWGAPDPSTIYVIYFQAGTQLQHDGAQCQAFGGYHAWADLANGTTIVFAAIPHCDPFGGLAGLDELTGVTTHELVEAATDPLIAKKTAFALPDDNHLAWQIPGGGEAGDMCAGVPGAFVRLGGHVVQRSWSNAASLAGHDPCVPHVGAEPFAAAAPVLEPVSTQGMSTMGVQVPVGTTKTIEVDVYSDGPMHQPCELAVADPKGPAALDLALDTTTAVNGDRVKLTIHTKQASPDGASTFILQCINGDTASQWHGLVVY